MAENAGSQKGHVMDDAVGSGPASGDFEASTEGQWGRQGIEGAGGAAVLSEGGSESINFDRFRTDPETELEVSWWNRRVVWQVRREPSTHEVIVARATENIWRVHLMVAAGAIALGVLGLVVFGGLNLLWGLLLAVLLGGAAYGALRIEQRNGESRVGLEELYVLDSVLWNGALKKARTEILTKTKSGQKAIYAEAVKYYREQYEAKYGDPDTGKVGKTWFNQDTGRIEPVPKFEVSGELKSNLLSEDERIGPESAVEQIGLLLSTSSQARARENLRKAYRSKPVRAENKGRGVAGCTCVACEVNAELGVRPSLFGAEAAHRVEVKRAREAAERARRLGEEVVDTGSIRAVMLDVATKMRSGQREQKVYDPEADAITSTRAIKARSELEQSRTAETEQESRAEESESAKERKARQAAEKKEAKARLAQQRSEAKAAGTKKPGTSRLPWLIGGAVALGVVVMVVVIVMGSGSKGPGTEIAEDTPRSSPTSQSQEPTPTTPKETEPPIPAGEQAGVPLRFGPNDRGNQLGGAGVIAAYEYNYYAEPRNAEAAQNLYAPGARGSIVELRNAMEANPSGTKYELTVTPVVPGKEYKVKLKVIWPGRGDVTVDQKFFTTYLDGKFYILRSE